MSILTLAAGMLRAGQYDNRDLTLTGRLDIRSAEKGDELPTFEMQAYNGEPISVEGWHLPVILDLRGTEFYKPSTPVIADHDPTARIGHTTDQQIDANGIRARGVVSATGAAAREFTADAKNKFPFEVSVGARVLRAVVIRDGESVTVNGKPWDGPIIHAKRTVIRELSALTLGADGTTSVTIAAQTAKKGTRTMPDNITTEQDDDQTLEAAELHRQDKIKALFARHDDVEKVEDPHSGRIVAAATYRKNALKRGDDPIDVRATLLEATLANGANTLNRPAIHMIPGATQAPDLHAQAFSCALLRGRFGAPASFERSGKRYGVEEMFSEQVLELADHAEIRNPSLSQLMDATIRQNGDFFSGNRKSDDFIRAYVRSAKSLEAAGGGPFSTLTVGNILEDAANKQLLMRFQMADPVWPQIAKQVPVDDFKPAKLYRLDENLGYVRLNAQGELTSGQLSDSKRTVQADTYGRMISLSRQHIYNDDLQAFTQIINGLADGSVWAIESAVATVLLENSGSFFALGNGNLIDDPLALDGLQQAEINFASHVGAGGKPIMFDAAILLTGSTLGVTARNVTANSPVLSVDNNANNIVATNPFAGKYTPLAWPYLDNTSIRTPEGESIPNQSSTLWFLLSDPAMGSVVAVALLSGSAAPTIQSSDTSFDTLGMQWRGFHDFGVALADEEYGVMSSGDQSSG